MPMYEDRPGCERLYKKIEIAVEEAYNEPIDDRLSYSDIVAALEFHKAIVMSDWLVRAQMDSE